MKYNKRSILTDLYLTFSSHKSQEIYFLVRGDVIWLFLWRKSNTTSQVNCRELSELKAPFTLIYISTIYTLIIHLIYKQLCLYINLNVKKQRVSLLCETICINQEFILFLKLIEKHSIQYFTTEFWILNWSLCYLSI